MAKLLACQFGCLFGNFWQRVSAAVHFSFGLFALGATLGASSAGLDSPRLIATVEGLREVETIFSERGGLRWVARGRLGGDALFAWRDAAIELCALPGRAGLSADQRSIVARAASVATVIDPDDCAVLDRYEFEGKAVDVDYLKSHRRIAALVRHNGLSLEVRDEGHTQRWPLTETSVEIGFAPTGEVFNLDTSSGETRLWRLGEPLPSVLALPPTSSVFFSASGREIFAARVGRVQSARWSTRAEREIKPGLSEHHRHQEPLRGAAMTALPEGYTLRAVVGRGQHWLLDAADGLYTFDRATRTKRKIASGQPEAVSVSVDLKKLAFVIREEQHARIYLSTSTRPLFAEVSESERRRP